MLRKTNSKNKQTDFRSGLETSGQGDHDHRILEEDGCCHRLPKARRGAREVPPDAGLRL